MPNIGPMELIVVLVIALLVLGPKRLPDAGRALGDGIRGFKSTLSSSDSDGHPPELDAAAAAPAATTRRPETERVA
jgi:sec-independent protein translocase protein TatA